MLVELEVYVKKLKALQAERAAAALRTPSDKTEFGYGQASGRYQGLLEAEELLAKVIEEIADESAK